MNQNPLPYLPEKFYLQLLHMKFRVLSHERYQYLNRLRRTETDDGYSLKPFDDTHSIFVHIPKCAGVSVSKALYGNMAGGHESFRTYVSFFEPRVIREYFKFTIVRNPWDRLVSAFHFLKKGGINGSDYRWASENLSRYDNFRDFVRLWVSKDNIYSYYHFIPQKDFILSPKNKVKLDFIGRLESLDQDFPYIANRIGVSADLPVSNKGNHKPYTEYYDDETIEIVREMYLDDVNLLGYEFDN